MKHATIGVAKFARLTLLVATSFLTACGAKEIECKSADFEASDPRCNFYHPNDVADTPVVIVGDSFWDYGQGYGAIPKAMIEKTGQTYFEVARSGAKTAYIKSVVNGAETNNPMPPAGVGDIKTILLNGGANNIRNVCKAGADDYADRADCRGVNSTNNTSPETLTCLCNDRLTSIEADLNDIMTQLETIETVDHIVYAGPQKFPTSQAYAFVQERARAHASAACSNHSKCSYVDNAVLWDYNGSGCFIWDNQHVTTVGASRIADNILNHLLDIGAFGTGSYTYTDVATNVPCE